MKYAKPLEHGTLIRRYKRFLADVLLADGRTVTIHCPNTGSMKHCAEPGDEVWFSTADNPKRKYPHTWELTRTRRGHYIGINTSRANALVRDAIEADRVAELRGYGEVSSEVRYGSENSRIDLLLGHHAVGAPDCYVEVKSVTLLEPPIRRGVGYFPDAVSTRGQKHLRELAGMAEQGYRAVLFFCVQHSGVRVVRPAAHIDIEYHRGIQEALAAGVEIIAYKARLSRRGVMLDKRIEFEPDPS